MLLHIWWHYCGLTIDHDAVYCLSWAYSHLLSDCLHDSPVRTPLAGSSTTTSVSGKSAECPKLRCHEGVLSETREMSDVRSFPEITRYCCLVSFHLVCRHTHPYQQGILLRGRDSRKVQCCLYFEDRYIRRRKFNVRSPSTLAEDSHNQALKREESWKLHAEGNGYLSSRKSKSTSDVSALTSMAITRINP